MYFDCQDCGAPFWRSPDERWKVRCLDCWKAAKTKEKAQHEGRATSKHSQADSTSSIDAQRLRQLLQLCHPDKHGGSELAERVTQWLNEIKRGVRA